MTKGLRKVFGKKFNKWDVILILLLGGSSYYILSTSSLEFLLDKAAWIIFGIAFGGLLIRILSTVFRKARK